MTCWLWKKNWEAFKIIAREIFAARQNRLFSLVFLSQKKLPNHEKMINLRPICDKKFAKSFSGFFGSLKIIKGEKIRREPKNVADELWTSHENSLKFSLSTTELLWNTLFMRISLTFLIISLSLRSPSLSCTTTIYILSAKVKKGRNFFLHGSVK